MTLPSVPPSQVRSALLLREEIALLDLRHEAAFATGHPLFAANMAADRIALEAEIRLPRKDVPIVASGDDQRGVTGRQDLAAIGACRVDGALEFRETAFHELRAISARGHRYLDARPQRGYELSGSGACSGEAASTRPPRYSDMNFSAAA
jgi:hypothetical protein